MHQVFISYSTADAARADELCALVEASGISCWIAPRDIAPAGEWAGALEQAISDVKTVLLVFSVAANESPQVLREIALAVEKRKWLVAWRIDDCKPTGSMKYFLTTVQWADGSGGVKSFPVSIVNPPPSWWPRGMGAALALAAGLSLGTDLYVRGFAPGYPPLPAVAWLIVLAFWWTVAMFGWRRFEWWQHWKGKREYAQLLQKTGGSDRGPDDPPRARGAAGGG